MTATWDEGSAVWRAMVDCLPDGVAAVDREGVQCFVNRAFCEMVGCEQGELLGARPPFCYWPEEHRESIERVFRVALAGDSGDFEVVLMRKGGERFPALVRPGIVRSRGQVVAHVAAVRDITERRRLEQAQQRSEQRWRSVAENPFDFVVTVDRDYRYTYVNHTAPGIRAEDLLGKATPFDFTDPKDHAVIREACERAFRGAHPGAYETYVPSLGCWFSTIVGPIVEDGVVTGVSLLTRDISAQKRAEQALRQTQRMEALGRLAGGIAHDFNNLLAPILGNAHLLRQGVAAGAGGPLLDDIIQAGERARELVKRILVFGRESSQAAQPVRMQDIVREVGRFVRTGAAANIGLRTNIDDGCAPVLGVPGELHQVVTNLCTNAVQALEARGGTLTLTVEAGELPPDVVGEGRSSAPVTRSATEAASRPAVRVVVHDDGPGIPEDVRPRIFDPFFTTRPVGQGTGLGLSIVQAIVARYRGTITVESDPSWGTRFSVLLPVQPTSAAAAAVVPKGSVEPAGKSLRLVCVDDEPLVLRWMTQTFRRAGHQVECFGDSREAARFLEAHATDVDCVISDETMPGLSGTQLARQIAAVAPSLPVLLVSGYGGAVSESSPPNIRAHLQKPINGATLLQEVLSAVEKSAL